MEETTRDKRVKEIAQLKAKLQKKEALLNATTRKQRDGELIAFGILVEEILKQENEFADLLKDKAKMYNLTGRNQERILSGIKRIIGKE